MNPFEALAQEPGPEQLLVLMLEGSQRFLSELIAAVEAGHEAEQARALGRILPILQALIEGLDPESGEMATNLARLYEWWAFEIQAAAEAGDTARLHKVGAQIMDIRDSWAKQLTAKSA